VFRIGNLKLAREYLREFTGIIITDFPERSRPLTPQIGGTRISKSPIIGGFRGLNRPKRRQARLVICAKVEVQSTCGLGHGVGKII